MQVHPHNCSEAGKGKVAGFQAKRQQEMALEHCASLSYNLSIFETQKLKINEEKYQDLRLFFSSFYLFLFSSGIGDITRCLWRFYSHQLHSCQQGKSGRPYFLIYDWSFLQTLLELIQKGQPTGWEHPLHFTCFWRKNEVHIFLHCGVLFASCLLLRQWGSPLTEPLLQKSSFFPTCLAAPILIHACGPPAAAYSTTLTYNTALT